ncbi:site-specific DNA-methyltransferase [Glaesserella parasuis]|nr:site-specific DNA-methyltransferase [Glaesserella parasuis]MDP0135966.1 site-specific DNA-methyltransferase [Glaesserella parasuis]MDP0276230.1 site-specific DNA-methyltransferase [Glaesserella parasuis]MDP0314662.1 site-specific DNA-methyltransferase [Glaesserella parasuis]
MLKKQTMQGGGKTPLNSNGYDDLQHLVVDTSLFSATFQSALISTLSRSLGDFDSHINGTLIHSDNFQALNLLQARYREQVKCIYIDPPYNTNASPIAYKNGYKDGSWLSLIYDRYLKSKNLLNEQGISITAIDDIELRYLYCLKDDIFGKNNYIGTITTVCNPQGRVSNKMSKTSEFHLFYSKNLEAYSYELRVDKLDLENIKDTPLKRTGTNSRREDRPLRYFPIFYKDSELSLPTLDEYQNIYDRENKKFDDSFVSFLVAKYQRDGFEVILPLKDDGSKLVWQREFPRVQKEIKTYIYKNGNVYTPKFENEIPRTSWVSSYYANPEYGTELVKEILGIDYLTSIKHDISLNTAKSIYTVKQMVKSNNSLLTLDYFAGSGTTAHAVINLNREDKGNRQYILVEQGEYFDTVLKPRVQKVIYSKAWKDGKPVAEDGAENLQGVPQIVKVLKLESYEDTLNNLELRRSDLFDHLPENAQQDYLLNYMLNIDSRGSLLNISHFEKPFDYGLNISTTSAGAYEWQKVDLVETFNYLIGARLVSIDDQRVKRGYVAIDCQLPNQSGDDKTLIIWRDCEQWHYENLYAEKEFSHNFQDSKTTLFGKMNFNPKNTDYAQVYINGDHTLETVWDGEQSGSLKIISIEDAFLSLMFEGDA